MARLRTNHSADELRLLFICIVHDLLFTYDEASYHLTALEGRISDDEFYDLRESLVLQYNREALMYMIEPIMADLIDEIIAPKVKARVVKNIKALEKHEDALEVLRNKIVDRALAVTR